MSDARPPTARPAAESVAAITAGLDTALAHRCHTHAREGRAAVVSPLRFDANRDIAGAAVTPGAHGLSVHGELDATTAPVLAALFAQSDLDRSRGFVIDLRELTSVDAAGIQALREMHAALTMQGQYAQVAPSTHPAAQVLLRDAVADGLLPAAFTFSTTYRNRDFRH